MAGVATGGYVFATEPRPVLPGPRTKYREDGPPRHANMMHDRRIVRGNAFQSVRLVPADAAVQEITHRPRPRRVGPQKSKFSGLTELFPEREAVSGRQHIEIQTDTYLEQITDRPEEKSIEVQTEAELDRPPTPLFIPKLTGVNQSTTIGEGDLFCFDKEVEPILERLVGQILDQGMTEVVRTEELAAMRAYREELRSIRRTELAETRRLEAEEKSKAEEKKQRVEQERARIRREQETKEKLAQQKFAKEFMQDVTKDTISALDRKGFFGDALMREIEVEFMPWLMSEANAKIIDLTISRRVVDDVIRSTLAKSEVYSSAARAQLRERLNMAQFDRKLPPPAESSKHSKGDRGDGDNSSRHSQDFTTEESDYTDSENE